VRDTESLGKELEEISCNLTVQEAVDTGQWCSIVSEVLGLGFHPRSRAPDGVSVEVEGRRRATPDQAVIASGGIDSVPLCLWKRSRCGVAAGGARAAKRPGGARLRRTHAATQEFGGAFGFQPSGETYGR
jgi:hypothetical protein